MVEDRNLNVQSILSGLHLGHPDFEITTQFNHLFFFGDLNYRIDLPREDVMDYIERADWTTLLEKDQLLNQKRG
jgi:hypothetical protein